MNDSENNNAQLPRRRFISNGIKATLLVGILSPLEQACNTKTKNTGKKQTKDQSKKVSKNKKRDKWNAEKLLVNSKTNVIHLPTASFYAYYDEIKNAKDVDINSWENQLTGETRFNKNKSGNILEILSLQKLRNGVNDNSLSNAANTLQIAFSSRCDSKNGININATNYRLHELMLQLVALNNSIPSRWQTFNQIVRKPQKLGKRQSWMADENSFNQRVKYIQDREAEYKDRLVKRASKYNLT